jgi:hypothetical protein
MTRSYFVALAFTAADDGSIVPGQAVECSSAVQAALRADVLARTAGNVGAVAFSRTEKAIGLFADAVILAKFGDLPSDLGKLF